jgi:DNA-binding transcriptional MerR regulator
MPTPNDRPLLSIGEVSRCTGMTLSRLRFYERAGLLAVPERRSGRRAYQPEVLGELQIIDAAQRVGFSLEEIHDLIWGRGDPAHERLRTLALRKLPETDRLIQRATAIRHMLELCSQCQCASIAECALLDDPLALPPELPDHAALRRRIDRRH